MEVITVSMGLCIILFIIWLQIVFNRITNQNEEIKKEVKNMFFLKKEVGFLRSRVNILEEYILDEKIHSKSSTKLRSETVIRCSNKIN